MIRPFRASLALALVAGLLAECAAPMLAADKPPFVFTGILGVATLGFYVDAAISELRLDVAVILIAATALVSIAVDGLSRQLRRALRVADLPTRLSRPLGPLQLGGSSQP